jgi:predicted GNAT family N-acyltransferase
MRIILNNKTNKKKSPLIIKISTPQQLQEAVAIRRTVFIDEQGVSEAEELDGLDKQCDHYLVTVQGAPVATARMKYVPPSQAKIERVGVLSEYRGYGLGKQLMEFILRDIKHSNKAEIVCLGSQTHAIPFYERLGFQVCSEEYQDARIAHRDMQLRVDSIHIED